MQGFHEAPQRDGLARAACMPYLALGRNHVQPQQRTMYPQRDMMMEVALMGFWGRRDWGRRDGLDHAGAWLGGTERAQ